MYVLKFIRMFIIAGALYLASNTFQSQYVSKVFVNDENPPNLIMFILTYVFIEVIFMALILFIVYLLKSVLKMNEHFPLTNQAFGVFVFDYLISAAIIALIGVLLATVVTKKKYFRYKTDGLRAIRSLQEMMFYVGAVVVLFPFFMVARQSS